MNEPERREGAEGHARAAAAGLEHAKIKYRDFLEGLGAAIFALDLEGRFIFLNEPALELLGYTKADEHELVGQHFIRIVAPEQGKQAQELFARGREMRPFVLQALRRDGRPVNVEVSGAWVRRRGRRVGALAMAWEFVSEEEAKAPVARELSKLDMTILQLVSRGLSNREIAERVYLSTHTIKDRIEKIMRAFGVNRRAELAAKAARQGLV